MKLPNAEDAVVPVEKVRDYLLSPRHPIGRFKASFFRRLGYTEEQWAKLEKDLRTQHLVLEAKEQDQTRYGRKFMIRGRFTGPTTETVMLISVWVIRRGEDFPRFVTAYPGGEL